MSDTIPTETAATSPAPANAAPPAAVPPDKLLAFREFMDKPVAVQLIRSYVAIVPMVDDNGMVMVQSLRGPNGEQMLVGLPDLTNPPSPQIVVRGVLRASACGTMLIMEQSIAKPRGFVDLLLRPEQVEYLAFVKEVPGARLPRNEDN